MSSSKRIVVERFNFENFQAVLYSTSAMQLFYTGANTREKETTPDGQAGVHVLTFTKVPAEMKNKGWLAEFIIGAMELYQSPVTMRAHEEAWQTDSPLIVDFNETHNEQQLQLVMEDSVLSRAEKVAALASAVACNIVGLSDADFTALLHDAYRLSELEPRSVHWGPAYSMYLTPLMSGASTASPVRDFAATRFRADDDIAWRHSVFEFLASEEDGTSLADFLAGTAKPTIRLRGDLDGLYLSALELRLGLVAKPERVASFTRTELDRYLMHFLTPQTTMLADWQAKRLLSGVEVQNELDPPVSGGLYALAGAVLSRDEYAEFEKFQTANSLRIFDQTAMNKPSLCLALLAIFAAYGVDKASVMYRELGVFVDERDWRAYSDFQKRFNKRADINKLLALIEEPYLSMTPAFALPLVEIHV